MQADLHACVARDGYPSLHLRLKLKRADLHACVARDGYPSLHLRLKLKRVACGGVKSIRQAFPWQE
ncbi:hypothetical protein BHM03_00025142 [Ensete ventricosum]|nr:hypothetical protein BHM03_00025142 [Ensete ventricosum]